MKCLKCGGYTRTFYPANSCHINLSLKQKAEYRAMGLCQSCWQGFLVSSRYQNKKEVSVCAWKQSRK